MEQVFELLRHDPRNLPLLEAEHETWRKPSTRSSSLPAPEDVLPGKIAGVVRALRDRGPRVQVPASRDGVLKLFQPAQQRHYLVAASLLCRRPGLPERSIDRSKQQSVSFVLRRLVAKPLADQGGNPAPEPVEAPAWDPVSRSFPGWTEFAWTPGDTARWEEVADPWRLPAGEERLPLFPAHFRDQHDHARRLLLGTVPVARRETYQNAPLAEIVDQTDSAPAPAEVVPDPRRLLLRQTVTGPWLSLCETATAPDGSRLPQLVKSKDTTDSDIAEALKVVRGSLQTGSWLILVDLFDFLMDQGNDEIAAILAADPDLEPVDSGTPAGALAKALWGVKGLAPFHGNFESITAGNLLTALRLAGRAKDRIEDPRLPGGAPRPDVQFPSFFDAGSTWTADQFKAANPGWPGFLFPLADPDGGIVGGSLLGGDLGFLNRTLADRVVAALAQDAALPDPSPVMARAGDPREAWYCIRAAMEHPECLTVHPELLSDPTTPFRLAGYFDPEAPARPIRIGLPIDPTSAGLRKFDRKTVFQLSDLMCSHASRMRSITFGDLVLSVLPWPFHKDLPSPGPGKCQPGNDMGMMLVMSLPIITICALIILMIMVALLDMVFKWLPFFLLWIPVRRSRSATHGGDV